LYAGLDQDALAFEKSHQRPRATKELSRCFQSGRDGMRPAAWPQVHEGRILPDDFVLSAANTNHL
jgi:hypothetical protein